MGVKEKAAKGKSAKKDYQNMFNICLIIRPKPWLNKHSIQGHDQNYFQMV